MFDTLFTPAVFPGTESKTDIITEAKTIRQANTIESIIRTRRISRGDNSERILPPFGYGNVWNGC
jgi:hypothetical protein